MRALTFEVICRAVFGVTEPERVARLRETLMAVIDTGSRWVTTNVASGNVAIRGRNCSRCCGDFNTHRTPPRCHCSTLSTVAR